MSCFRSSFYWILPAWCTQEVLYEHLLLLLAPWRPVTLSCRLLLELCGKLLLRVVTTWLICRLDTTRGHLRIKSSWVDNRGTGAEDTTPTGLMALWETQSLLVICFGSLQWCGPLALLSCSSCFYLLQTEEFQSHFMKAPHTYHTSSQPDCAFQWLLAFSAFHRQCGLCPIVAGLLIQKPSDEAQEAQGRERWIVWAAFEVPADLEGHLKLQPNF